MGEALGNKGGQGMSWTPESLSAPIKYGSKDYQLAYNKSTRPNSKAVEIYEM